MEELRKEEYEGFDPPSWIWVSIQDGSRRSEEMEDLALSYCEKENVIVNRKQIIIDCNFNFISKIFNC